MKIVKIDRVPDLHFDLEIIEVVQLWPPMTDEDPARV